MVEEVRVEDHMVSPGIKSDPEADTHRLVPGLYGRSDWASGVHG